jgi:putative PIN family toxin of toxin-antitoxin system
MRVVCDSNVLARAAVRPLGPARAVFIAALTPPHRLVLSEPMLVELARVLRYERVRIQANLNEEEIDSFVTNLRDVAELVELPAEIPHIAADPDDDLVVATAVAGKCDVLCTRDRHLRHRVVQAYCATFGIRILTDAELMPEFRSTTDEGGAENKP